MNAPAHYPQLSQTNAGLKPKPGQLHDLAQRAITASDALTAACLAGRTMSDAEYARIDHQAYAARRELLDCLNRDYGIDNPMADQLGALL